MQWADVVRVHGGWAGVSVRSGRVSSLLVAKGSGHENQVVGDELLYAVPNRPSYRVALAALRESATAGASFRVFRKRRQNDWEDIGPHCVVEASERDGVVYFRLRRAAS